MEETTLTIKIENKKPIELNQLTLSLNALSNLYDSFVINNIGSNSDKIERTLYISEVSKGSIVIVLIGAAAAAFPMIESCNTIIEFFEYLKSSYNYFLGKIDNIKYKYNKRDLDFHTEFLNLSAKDNGSNTSIFVKGNQVNNYYNIDTIQANAMQNGLNEGRNSPLYLNCKENTQSMRGCDLVIKKVDFLGNSKWTFITFGKTIEAKILDDEFLRKIKNREIAISAGDRLICSLKSISKIDENYNVLEASYDITEVSAIKAGDDQTKLFNPEEK